MIKCPVFLKSFHHEKKHPNKKSLFFKVCILCVYVCVVCMCTHTYTYTHSGANTKSDFENSYKKLSVLTQTLSESNTDPAAGRNNLCEEELSLLHGSEVSRTRRHTGPGQALMQD